MRHTKTVRPIISRGAGGPNTAAPQAQPPPKRSRPQGSRGPKHSCPPFVLRLLRSRAGEEAQSGRSLERAQSGRSCSGPLSALQRAQSGPLGAGQASSEPRGARQASSEPRDKPPASWGRDKPPASPEGGVPLGAEQAEKWLQQDGAQSSAGGQGTASSRGSGHGIKQGVRARLVSSFASMPQSFDAPRW